MKEYSGAVVHVAVAADGDAHLDDCAAGVQELCGVLRFLHNSAQLFSRILVMK